MTKIEYMREGVLIEERPESLESAVEACYQNLAFNSDTPSFRPRAIIEADGRRIEGEALRSMVADYARKAGLPSPV